MQSTVCTGVPGLWLPFFLLLWLPWVCKFTRTSASSFFFCASACAFAFSSTSLSWCRGFSKDGAKAECEVIFWKSFIVSQWLQIATHSSILTWRIPETEESGGLLSMGSRSVRHDWSDLAAAAVINEFYSYPSWYLYFFLMVCQIYHDKFSCPNLFLCL